MGGLISGIGVRIARRLDANSGLIYSLNLSWRLNIAVLQRSYILPIVRATIDRTKFNSELALPYGLRTEDFALAMQDVYDFFFDINTNLSQKNLGRLDDMLRPQAMTGIISDMLTACLARHSRTLCENKYHNGHPDLIVRGRHKNDSAQSADEGVEIKSTRKRGGAVDTHGARNQWMCVFVYAVDSTTEPVIERDPSQFTEVYIAEVKTSDFRKNKRGELGTDTATLDRNGLGKLRAGWVYKI